MIPAAVILAVFALVAWLVSRAVDPVTRRNVALLCGALAVITTLIVLGSR